MAVPPEEAGTLGAARRAPSITCSHHPRKQQERPFKTELIRDRVWKTRTQLELTVVEWVGWYNHDRLHSALDHVPPVEYEALHARQDDSSPSLMMSGNSKSTIGDGSLKSARRVGTANQVLGGAPAAAVRCTTVAHRSLWSENFESPTSACRTFTSRTKM